MASISTLPPAQIVVAAEVHDTPPGTHVRLFGRFSNYSSVSEILELKDGLHSSLVFCRDVLLPDLVVGALYQVIGTKEESSLIHARLLNRVRGTFDFGMYKETLVLRRAFVLANTKYHPSEKTRLLVD